MQCAKCGQWITWEKCVKLGHDYCCRAAQQWAAGARMALSEPNPFIVTLTPEEEAAEARREAEQQALKDRNRPEEYDRWPGRAGWVGNAS